MNRLFVLLPMLFLGTVTFAAPGLRPGLTEFSVELPRELRLVAGRGQLSPVEHALVAIAAPANFDMTRDWPVIVISATSDRPYHSSRRLLAAYADTALKAEWILVAADPMEDVAVEKDDTALRFALNAAALSVLESQWPRAAKAPLAFGGFSGGAKYSGWLAAAFASQGRTITGIYLAGISTDWIVAAAKDFMVLTADFKRIPILLQYGDNDVIATPSDHWRIYDELKRAGFKNLRIERFRGTHEIDPAPLRKGLDWFRESAAPPAASK